MYATIGFSTRTLQQSILNTAQLTAAFKKSTEFRPIKYIHAYFCYTTLARHLRVPRIGIQYPYV